MGSAIPPAYTSIDKTITLFVLTVQTEKHKVIHRQSVAVHKKSPVCIEQYTPFPSAPAAPPPLFLLLIVTFLWKTLLAVAPQGLAPRRRGVDRTIRLWGNQLIDASVTSSISYHQMSLVQQASSRRSRYCRKASRMCRPLRKQSAILRSPT